MTASSLPPLRPDEVHVWRLTLEQDASTLEQLGQLLAPDERARAERFVFAKHREHFIAGRGQLRVLLGRYLQREPAELAFVYNFQGKPALAGTTALRFNLAHSHGLAVLAVTFGRELGVDVERVRPEVSTEGIAERHFSLREIAVLRALPAEQRVEAFFRCWTRKEAYIKAVGKGLSLPLDSFDVTLAPDEPAALLAVREPPGEAARWCLREVPVPAGYFAAVVVEGQSWQLECGDWPRGGEVCG